jgi:hypothetical protein
MPAGGPGLFGCEKALAIKGFEDFVAGGSSMRATLGKRSA